MKNTNLLLLILIALVFIQCGLYFKIEEQDGLQKFMDCDGCQNCQEVYALSTKSYKTKYSTSTIENAWRQDGFNTNRDTTFSNNGKWMSPQIKVFNYKNNSITHEVSYVNFVIFEVEQKSSIQIHGICFAKHHEEELTTKELKRIEKLIKLEFIERFID